jgi:type VI secretion system protein VasG
MVVVPYYPLSDSVLGRIIRMQLSHVAQRMQRTHGVELRYGDELVETIAARCTEPESGGRMIGAILGNTILPGISRQFLERLAADEPTSAVDIAVSSGELQYTFT